MAGVRSRYKPLAEKEQLLLGVLRAVCRLLFYALLLLVRN